MTLGPFCHHLHFEIGCLLAKIIHQHLTLGPILSPAPLTDLKELLTKGEDTRGGSIERTSNLEKNCNCQYHVDMSQVFCRTEYLLIFDIYEYCIYNFFPYIFHLHFICKIHCCYIFIVLLSSSLLADL